jgi:hypothetical protein
MFKTRKRALRLFLYSNIQNLRFMPSVKLYSKPRKSSFVRMRGSSPEILFDMAWESSGD